MQVSVAVIAEMLDDDREEGCTSQTSKSSSSPTAPTPFKLPAQHDARSGMYEGLSFARRRDLHAQAAEALERRAGEDTSSVAEILALHFAQAARHEKAWLYARLAGERAQQSFAPLEATTFFELAIESGRELPDVTASDLLAVSEALGDSQARLGEFAKAETTYQEARRWAGRPSDRARLRYKVAQSTDREGDYTRTLGLLTRAGRELECDDSAADPLRAEITTLYGLVRHQQGRGRDAVRLLRQAVGEAEQAKAPEVLATALLHLDMAELAAGQTGDGSHAERAVAIAREYGGNPWLEARALNQLGIRAYFAGRWPEAIAHYLACRAANEKAGDQWTAAIATGNIAEVLSDQGHLVEAEAMLEDAVEVSLGGEDPPVHRRRIEAARTAWQARQQRPPRTATPC